MNKKIKEYVEPTLEYLKMCVEDDVCFETTNCKALLDYITNLEEENEKKDKIINEFEIWLSNEINFQKVVGRDHELRKVWFHLQDIQENILTGGDENE